MTTWLTPSEGASSVINGLGDMELSGRVLVVRDKSFAAHHLLWATAGLKIPTAPRLNDDRGDPYPDDDQPGSGSWDPFVGVTYAGTRARRQLAGAGMLRVAATVPVLQAYIGQQHDGPEANVRDHRAVGGGGLQLQARAGVHRLRHRRMSVLRNDAKEGPFVGTAPLGFGVTP